MENKTQTVYGTTKVIKSLSIDATKNRIGIIGFIPVFENHKDAEKFSDDKGEIFSIDIKK